MARTITEDNLTEAVLALTNTRDPRMYEIVTKLVRHLHAFIRDLEPTEEEWLGAIKFLTRTGQMCDDKRQEFILLSDVLGASMLVDAINHRQPGGATETTVTGPFHSAALSMEMGANIARGVELESGEPTAVHGTVRDLDGNPIEGAVLDVWQANDAGSYDMQDPNQPEMNLRGIFRTGADGRYWFRTVKPSSYPIPSDGPVGDLLAASGRHPMRPAHIHFMISAPGYRQLITHLFVEGDEYLESDAVFGVKDSLVVNFERNESADDAATYGVTAPFFDVAFDFGLSPRP